MTVRRLFETVLFFSLLGMTTIRTSDPDLWWHLKTGQRILADGIPRHDLFSYTVPDRVWITHEWLSQVVMWLLYDVAGLVGLIVAFWLLITLSLWLVYLVSPGRPYVAGFVIVLAAMTSSGLWGARPQMINFLMLAIFLFLIEGQRQRSAAARARGAVPSTRLLWALPPLTALWANFHSGYLLGVVLVATYVVGDAFQRRLVPGDERVWSWPEIRRGALLVVASLLAALLNPNGVALWRYPFDTLGSPMMQQHIVEWFSPDFHSPYNWPFAAMGAVGVLAFVWGQRRPTWTDLLLFGGTAAATLVSVRHMPLFALVASPVLARAVLSSLRGSRLYDLLSGARPARPLSRTLGLVNWILAGLVVLFPLARIVEAVSENDAEVAERYPTAALAFLESSGLAEQRVFNSYNWGGYLIWQDIPVFVDGRADVYGDEFLDAYFDVTSLSDGWQETLDRYGVDYVLFEAPATFSGALRESPAWEEAYRDDLASIFVRRDASAPVASPAPGEE